MCKISYHTIKQLFDIIYDILISAFSIVDIICDICVAYEFYKQEKYVFFYISLVIFILAQISYASIMTISMESTKSNQSFRQTFISHFLIFIISFPLGQFVPLFLMIQDIFSPTFIKFYKKHNYRNIFLDEEELKGKNSVRKKAVSELSFSDYIKRKTISHIGFIAESIIEAIPQSILQMVFIILYNDYNTIHIFSIFMSMIVVVSKGSLLTYSVYKPASIFNFLCFAVDIFGIFACVSWLFCLSNQENTTYIIMGYGVWGIAYYYFIVLYIIFFLLIILAILGLGMMFVHIYELQPEYPWKELMQGLVLYGGCVLLTLPVSLILFTVRFTLIPLFILRGLDHSRQKSMTFYRKLFNFLLKKGDAITDMHYKLMIANWRLAVLTYKHNQQTKITTDKTVISKCEQISQLNHKQVSLVEIYGRLQWYSLQNYHWILSQMNFNKFYKELKKVFKLLINECYKFLMKHK
eukprot:422159_1